MAITHIQGAGNTSGPSATLSVTLSSAPSLGNLVIVGIGQLTNNTTLSTVQDQNGNSYSISTGSPSPIQSNGSAGRCWVAYLLSAPANAHKQINITWSSSGGSPNATADEFSNSGFTAAFDTDNSAAPGSGSMVTPTITPSVSHETLFSTCNPQGSLSTPTAGGTSGSWTGSAGNFQDGCGSEYILDSGTSLSAVGCSYTQTSSAWSAMIASFTWSASGGGGRGLFEQTPMNGIALGGSFFPHLIGRMRLAPIGHKRKDRIFVPERFAA